MVLIRTCNYEPVEINHQLSYPVSMSLEVFLNRRSKLIVLLKKIECLGMREWSNPATLWLLNASNEGTNCLFRHQSYLQTREHVCVLNCTFILFYLTHTRLIHAYRVARQKSLCRKQTEVGRHLVVIWRYVFDLIFWSCTFPCSFLIWHDWQSAKCGMNMGMYTFRIYTLVSYNTWEFLGLRTAVSKAINGPWGHIKYKQELCYTPHAWPTMAKSSSRPLFHAIFHVTVVMSNKAWELKMSSQRVQCPEDKLPLPFVLQA